MYMHARPISPGATHIMVIYTHTIYICKFVPYIYNIYITENFYFLYKNFLQTQLPLRKYSLE